MANKADNCTTGYLVSDLQTGNSELKLPEGVTLETIEDIGYGQGVNFWLSPGDIVEFPAKDKLRIDIEKFKKLNGDYGYTLVARVWISSYDDYTWMPLSILRRIPCNDYRDYLTAEAQEALLAPMKGKSEAEISAFVEGKGFKAAEDGKLYKLIHEERDFFATYPLGREMAARNKSDLGVYREMAGRTIEVEEVKLLHKHEFAWNRDLKKGVRLNTFTGIFCYRFKENKAPKKSTSKK